MMNKCLNVLKAHGIDCWSTGDELFAVDVWVNTHTKTTHSDVIKLPLNIREIKNWLGY